MNTTRMLSVDQFLDELKKRGGSASRSDLLRRWKNGNMTSNHLDWLITATGCACEEIRTRGRTKIMISHP